MRDNVVRYLRFEMVGIDLKATTLASITWFPDSDGLDVVGERNLAWT
jgi:hypothetical protein